MRRLVFAFLLAQSFSAAGQNPTSPRRTPQSPRPVPSQPTGLELTMGDEDGELTGQCEGQPRLVDYYEIEFTLTDPNLPTTTWQHAAVSQKSYFEIKNLPTGQKSLGPHPRYPHLRHLHMVRSSL